MHTELGCKGLREKKEHDVFNCFVINSSQDILATSASRKTQKKKKKKASKHFYSSHAYDIMY